MAVNGLKGFGWFLTGMIVAPACYMVTSQVAAERAKLQSMDTAIIETHRQIRGLETEFNARANMAQLERWNGEALAMAAPTAQQYVPDEAALASLDRAAPAQMQAAALVVPGAEHAQPQPASATAADQAKPVAHGPAGLAENEPKADRARGQAMAMLDDKLLSRTTMDDIRQRARSEALALR